METKDKWLENLSLKIIDSNQNRNITLDSFSLDEEPGDDQAICLDILNLNSGKLLINGIYPRCDSIDIEVFNCRDSSSYNSKPLDVQPLYEIDKLKI